MATVGKSKHAAVKLERNVHVHIVRRSIGLPFHLRRGRKPQELPVQPKVHRQNAAIQFQHQIFSMSFYIANRLFCRKPRKLGRILRFRCDWMRHMNATYFSSTNERPQSAHYCFNFGKFRHGV